MGVAGSPDPRDESEAQRDDRNLAELQQQRGGDRGQDQAGQVQITLGRAVRVEPVGERQREQEPEQDPNLLAR